MKNIWIFIDYKWRRVCSISEFCIYLFLQKHCKLNNRVKTISCKINNFPDFDADLSEVTNTSKCLSPTKFHSQPSSSLSTMYCIYDMYICICFRALEIEELGRIHDNIHNLFSDIVVIYASIAIYEKIKQYVRNKRTKERE